MPPPPVLIERLHAYANDLKLDSHSLEHHVLAARDLQNPTKTQQITLGVIAVYVVVIAILWNVPYVKNILWPFKVRLYCD
jgi:hypothetical protein